MMDKSFTSNLQGNVLERDFSQSVISIGSHRDNDVVLSGEGIFPFHATVLLEGEEYRIIPAETGARIWVDGNSLQDAYALFDGSQRIEIGTFALFFQGNGLPDGVHVIIYPGTDEEAPEEFFEDDTAEAIIVKMIAGEADIEVEQSAFFEFEVVNAGPIVARFTVSLLGVPKEWVEISPSVMNLNEGKRQLVRVRVTPPHDPGSEAGTHTLQVVVTSPNYGRQRAVEDISLTIQPFYEFSLGNLAPRTQRIPWRKRKGITYLPISNRSNTLADFNLLAMDDENGCSFDFLLEEDLALNRQASFKLQPRESIELPIQITPLKNPMFALRSKQFHYTTNVQIPQQVTAPQIVSGAVKRIPLFGWWSIMLGMATLLLALFFILQPNIRSFDVAAGKDVIELGDTTKLVWDVSPFATRLSLSNLEQPINRGQVSQTVAPGQSTTYELVSGNWLSGMFGLDQKESVTVLVVSPTPQVNVFEVDRTEISKGQLVRVRWSVSEADEVLLTIDEVVYPLVEEDYSGEREVLLERDALITLEAKNASGSELQSHFVNVVPPFININTFAVWVRADSAALNPNSAEMAGLPSGGKLFSPTNAPDPNFPVKFVEMVPEPDSETGYRVQFNPDVRDELQKGEQVMLEWDIDGAEALQIAPFTDALPLRGSQPFFPQESMNFVMTGQSGELESIFMLPVKVFDGEPPVAPTIDFFKGSPASMVGAGEVEFSWSVSGEWTRVNLSDADGVIADYLNPVGFTKIKIEESATLILTAYNGELSTAKDVQITVDPSLIAVDVEITDVLPVDQSDFLVGDKVTVKVAFGDLPADKPKPTGTIIVTDGVSNCEITLPAEGCVLEFKSPGNPVEIIASYQGDTIYLQADSDPFTGRNITVESVKAVITPTYFDATLAKINDISVPVFELDDTLHIEFNVQAVGTSLPIDTKGQIYMKVCDQEAGQDAIVSGSCVGPVALNTVAVNTQGIGTTVIDLSGFDKAGDRVFLFEYRHADNAIAPSNYFEYNITVGKRPIELSWDVCSNTPTPFTNCEIGVTDANNTTVTFDIFQANSTTPLLSTLPQPIDSDFNVFQVNSGGTKLKNWDCAVKKVLKNNVGVYVLECLADLSDPSPILVQFSYANTNSISYSMGSTPTQDYLETPFSLVIKKATVVSLNPTLFVDVSVGEEVVLTNTGLSGALQLNFADATGAAITSTTGKITIVGTKSLFGVVSGSSCSVAETLTEATLTINSIPSDCSIYFKKAGTFDLDLAYEGDSTKKASISAASVDIGPQESITTIWMDSATAGNYQVWDVDSLEQNTRLYSRIKFAGPADFVLASLTGEIVKLTFQSSNGVCTLRTANGIYSINGTTKVVDIPIVMSNGIAYIDFNLECVEQRNQVTLGISFANTGLSIDPTSDNSQTFYIVAPGASGPGGANMSVTVKRKDNSVVPSIGSNVYIGEEYLISLSIGTLWADSNGTTYPTIQSAVNYYTNTYVLIDLPIELESRLDTVNSTCAWDSVQKVAKVRMNGVQVYWHSPDPPATLNQAGVSDVRIYNTTACSLIFSSGVDIDPLVNNLLFTYNATTPSYGNFISFSETHQTLALLKRDTSIGFSPSLPGIGWIGAPVVHDITINPADGITGTNPPIDTGSTFASHFGFNIPVTGGGNPCAEITNQQLIDSTHARFTLTPLEVCSTGEISYRYYGNSWFNDTGEVLSGVTVDFRAPKTTTVTPSSSPSPSTYGASATLSATVTASSGTPTGSVVFKEGALTICSDLLNASGIASCSVSTLSVTTHNLTAKYVPDTAEFVANSANFSHTVNPVTTTVTLTTPSTSTYGQSFTINASVTGSQTVSEGTVAFVDSGTGTTLCTDTSVTAGDASCTVNSVLTTGNHTIAVQYTGTTNFSDDSATGTHTVNKATPTVVLSASPTSGAYGTTINFTATVTKPAGMLAGVANLSGTVNYGPSLSSCSAVALGTGCSSSTLVPNTYSITATYSGDTNYSSIPSNSVSVTISNSSTSAALYYAGTTAKTTACNTSADWNSTFPFGTPTANNAVEATDYFFCVRVTDTSTPITTVNSGQAEIWVEQGGTELATSLYTVAGGTAVGTRYRVSVVSSDAKFTLRFLAAIVNGTNTIIYYRYRGDTATYFAASAIENTVTFQIKP